MNVDDAVLERVRSADPLDPLEVLEWSHSDDSLRMLDLAMHSDVATLAGHRRRRRRRLVVTAVVVTGALTTAAAAAGVLGSSAPDRVREHLASLDEGLPDDLRLNPDVEHARAVAATESGVLYAADLTNGGYCLEVVTDGDRPRGAVCVTAAHLGDRPVEVTAPIPDDPAGALLVGGRINDERVQQVEVRFADGRTAAAELGLDRYWLFEVPSAEHETALSTGLVVAGISSDDHDVITVTVPAFRDDDPDGTKLDRLQPIFVSTISTGDDLTMLLGVEGSVNVADAETLELQYPNGTTTVISMATDGSYRFMVPAARQRDFATASGRLVARNATGDILATVAVTSVANSQPGG